jgi:hypothetical protein
MTARIFATEPTSPSGRAKSRRVGSPMAAIVLASSRSLTKALTTAF